MRCLVLSACGLTLPGCYKYVPASFDALPTGATVRAVISTEAQEDLEARVGVDLGQLNGTLVETNGDRLLLSVKTGRGVNEFGAQELYQRIDVERDDVVRVDVRRMDVHATAGLGALLATGVTFVTIEVLRGGEPGTPEPPNPDPDERWQRYFATVPGFRR
jgi:hypothetical protein